MGTVSDFSIWGDAPRVLTSCELRHLKLNTSSPNPIAASTTCKISKSSATAATASKATAPKSTQPPASAKWASLHMGI